MKRSTTLTALLCVFLALIAMSIGSRDGFTGNASTSAPQQPATHELQKRTRSDEAAEFMKEGPQGPSGLWSVAATPDSTQIDDSSIPVVLLSTSSMAGQGRWVNLIVSRALFRIEVQRL